ncbi:MAG TPA: ATP-dependent Clp protease proteolytic subunit [Clostridia bacterium]|nr:ATP-dependent Clp protease proteolytic subunit [Clostridia bacterium]
MSRRSTGLLTSNVKERRVLVRGKISRSIASCSIARLLVLATDDHRQPIVIHIDSPGGLASDSLGVISTINGIRSPVATFCRGEVGGTAAAIAAHGVKGCRVAAPGARFSLKLPEVSEGSRHANQESHFRLLVETLSKDTGKPENVVAEWLASDAVFGPEEAVARGLVDLVSTEPVMPNPVA